MVYDYRKNLLEDLKTEYEEFIKWYNGDSENLEQIKEDFYDHCWICDSVTGNASGSYTFNAWTAEEFLTHNYGLIQEAFECFGYDSIPLDRGPEVIDVTIRCYLLAEMIEIFFDSLND